MQEDIRRRIEQFIQEGENLVRELDSLKRQRKSPGQEVVIDLLSRAAGEIAGQVIEIPGAKGFTRKYSKKYIEAQHRADLERIDEAFIATCDAWLERIVNFLRTVSMKRSNLTLQGNSHILTKRFNRIYSYAKPETRARNTISILRGILNYPLIYNTEIPNILKKEKQKRLEDPYRILQRLETKLRECIQTELETLSKNWWKERVPNDIREKAELRKNKDERQWPWHTSKDLPPVFYVDFTDYVKIVTRRDNWKDAFQKVFKDKESISVKLRELEPMRNAIAHYRELTQKEFDKLKLLSEEIISCFIQKG